MALERLALTSRSAHLASLVGDFLKTPFDLFLFEKIAFI